MSRSRNILKVAGTRGASVIARTSNPPAILASGIVDAAIDDLGVSAEHRSGA